MVRPCLRAATATGFNAVWSVAVGWIKNIAGFVLAISGPAANSGYGSCVRTSELGFSPFLVSVVLSLCGYRINYYRPSGRLSIGV